MNEDDIRRIVSAVLEEESKRRGAAVDEVVLKAVATILTSFGIEEEDRLEMRADFAHLRKWRKSVEQAQGYTWKVVITTIATGIVGAIIVGFQTMLHK